MFGSVETKAKTIYVVSEWLEKNFAVGPVVAVDPQREAKQTQRSVAALLSFIDWLALTK